jgi:hypothetical protein
MVGLYDPLGRWLRMRAVPAWVIGLLHAVALVAALVGLYLAWTRLEQPWENEAFGFWGAWRDGVLYDSRWLDVHVYVYSPVLAQLAYPLTLLSWPTFSLFWNAAHLSALVAIAGPMWAAGLIWLLPWPTLPGYDNAVLATLENGNPMLFLALFVVAAYRWPAFWALAILMKVTPAVGLVWYVARGEWRGLAIAVGATVVLGGVSFLFAPQLWLDWARLLVDAAGRDALGHEIIPVPLAVRGLAATALVAWGARTDRYWTVPVGVMMALPAIQLGGYAVAVGALAFVGWQYVPRFWAARRGVAEGEPLAG